MKLYKFTLIFTNDEEVIMNTFCKYPQMTSLYRNCKTLLELQQLKSFSYTAINN